MIIDSGDDEIDVFVDIKKEIKPTRVTFGARLGDPNKEDDDESDDESDDSSSSSEENSNNHSKMKKRYGRSITNGLADFVAQEEMDRYRGFWWDEASQGILFVRVDESCVPPYRITHQGRDGIAGDESNHEDHRYPFAGENNPEIALGYIPIDRDNILALPNDDRFERSDDTKEENKDFAELNWSRVKWFDAPDEAAEYLARVNWLPGGSACVQWQDRRQSKLVLVKIDIQTGESVTLHREQSDVWINLHHMFKLLPHTIHPNECLDTDRDESLDMSLPKGSFSFLFASERTGYCHIYLYTFVPGDFSATLLRAVTAGDWIVESIVGVDMENDMVYVTGTYDSPLERHLYALPLRSSNQESRGADENVGVSGVRRGLKQVMTTLSGASPSSRKYHVCSYDHAPAVCTVLPPNPIRLTIETGMHSIVMDETCRLFVDTCSDLTRPPSSKVYSITNCKAGGTTLLFVLYDATLDLKDDIPSVSAPELISFPTSDGSETLHAAVYYPDKSVHGSGPYPLICAVYGGPHVQRVNRSWCQCADMRAQRLSSMGCVVIKCDNRGSSRRGLAFEGAIKKNLGRVEVLDQVAAVRYLVLRRIADPSRVGIYGWSYGGYLAAMCLCRAPDVFHVAIAGAPVTSWDGYDTHYTERYMGLPSENASGYHEAAVFQHIQNMRGKLLIIHGLIDENVHFRHTARLINRLISGGKDYDLLIFPDERHSPRRLRDRVYMEKRMSDYFVKHLLGNKNNNRGEVMLMGHL
jgi:dipeptidyl-peptidase-4